MSALVSTSLLQLNSGERMEKTETKQGLIWKSETMHGKIGVSEAET